MENTWNNEYENILVTWANRAQGYSWMYSRKEINIYEHISLIAVAINAGINFSITLLPEEKQQYSLFIMGILNIITLLLTAIYKIYTTPRIPEENRTSHIAWNKLYRNIKTQLALHPEQRENVKEFTKRISYEYDKLIEFSPTISDKVIQKYAELKKEKEAEIINVN
jgi:hypothetical protein